MRFIVSTTTLLKHLQCVSGALSPSTTLPILENFLFDIQDGVLTVSATDLQTSMVTSLEVDAKENGKIAVPSKILIETLKTLPDQPIAFSVDKETLAIEISAGDGKYKLTGNDGEDFPKIPSVEGTASLSMSASALSECISKTIFAVANDDLRPAMSGVYCQLSTQDITFVATDAHKLVRYRRKDVSAASSSSIILPKKALNLLKAALPVEDVTVSVDFNSTSAFFKFNNVRLVCRLIDERYPDYEAVIPLDNPNKLVVDKGLLLSTLKRVVIYANKTTHQVRLKMSGSELHISSEDLDFSNEAHERLTCQYDGQDMEIGFNARFLIEMLHNIDGEEVLIEMSQPSRAALILPHVPIQDEDLLMLVMPVMLHS